MSDWQDGEVKYVQGSGSKPYKLMRQGDVYSCGCPAWRNQSKPIDQRTCKHIIGLRGKAIEEARIAGKPAAMPVGVPAPRCDCHQGGTCDISHDPAVCSCAHCVAGQEGAEELVAQVMGAQVAPRAAKAQENPVPPKNGAIERDKSKRVNRFGGFVPFTDREKAAICAEEEARLGRKLRQDEKTDLFGPPVLLANTVEDDFDPTGWFESEKLDGVRAYWNGEVFVSRQGNIYAAPEFFRAELPQVPLDGELWMGRKMFQKTISVVKSAGSGKQWEGVSFVVFDAPNRPEGFESRLAYIFSLDLGHFAFGHPHSPCKSRQEAEEHLKAAEAAGAEGLMYRKPGSLYEGRRSSTLLKFKPFKDMEVTVVGHEPGKGRHKGRLGGLVVRLDNGKTFNVGTGLTDAERNSPPAIGCRATIRFTEFTNDGVPKCASFVAVRDYE